MAKCTQCGAVEGQSDGLCSPCRVRALGLKSRKRRWTDELRAELREAYAGKKPQRSTAISRMAEKTGWPRHAFKLEAIAMGLTTYHTRRWTAGEIGYVRERAGTTSTKAMARALRRSVGSVAGKMEQLGMSRRVGAGYSIADLRDVFGATGDRVQSWMRRGLLGTVHPVNGLRVTEAHVVRFIRRHPHEYDLRRVDQFWFKAMVFGRLASLGERL